MHTSVIQGTQLQFTAYLSSKLSFKKMGKNLDLKMFLSRQSKHYHPGEVVSGECVLQLNDHLKLRSVSIEFQGESWTYWEETELYTSTHKNAEIYFHKKTTLFGNCK